MWIFLSLVSALSNPGHSATLKQSAKYADVVLSTVVFRLLAGFFMLTVLYASRGWPPLTPGFFRALIFVVPPEVGGMLFMGLALRAGDLSTVQPLLGLIPVFVTLGGIFVLEETPSPIAGLGVVLVTMGVYTVGLGGAASWKDPIRALLHSRASWYAIATSFFWSVTTLTHKFGIAEVGALPWSVAVTLVSAVALLAGLLLSGPGSRLHPFRSATHTRRWMVLMAATALLFASHMYAVQAALEVAPAAYVIGLSSVGTLVATGLGIWVFRERAGLGHRVIGSALVTVGAIMIALLG